MFLFTGVDLLQSLSEFVSNQRDYFDSFEKSAKQINSVTQNFKQNKRSIKRKKNNMTIAAHEDMMSPRDKFKKNKPVELQWTALI